MRRLHLAALLSMAGIGASPLACNVFVTIESCSSNADCLSGFVCDRRARFCIDQRADAGHVDAPANIAADATADADADAVCHPGIPFGIPTLVGGLEELSVSSARFTPDEKTVIFSALKSGCSEERCADLFFAKRLDASSPFVVSGPLPGVDVNVEQASEYWPTMTADGLLLFLESARSVDKIDGGYLNDQSRIWTATRPNASAEFSQPYIQTLFRDIPGPESSPYLHPNGTSLYFVSGGRPGKGSLDLFVALLNEFGGATSVTNLDAVNTATAESTPVLTLDDRVLYFAREDATFRRHVMVSSRPTRSGLFGPGAPVAELNTRDEEFPTWVSDDHCRLYFVSNRPLPDDAGSGPGNASYRLWLAARPK